MQIEKVVKMNALIDLYGNLLTDNQLEILKMFYEDNIGLSEIAMLKKISRQAAYDTVSKAETFLEQTEEKLKLYEKLERLKNFAKEKLKESEYQNFENILKGE